MSWIKMNTDLSGDPSVLLMADELKIKEQFVVGLLHEFWSWADRHTADGFISGATASWIDKRVGHKGFGCALESAGWINFSSDGAMIPNFHRHNGESAKARIREAEKKRKQRQIGKPLGTLSPPRGEPVPKTEGQKGDLDKIRVDKSKEEKKETPKEEVSGFDKFWKAWPRHSRKASRGECLKVWIRKKLNEKAEHILQVLELLKQSEQWTKDNRQYIPAPLVWLNQERYDGDLFDIEANPAEDKRKKKEAHTAALKRKMEAAQAAERAKKEQKK